MNAITEVEIDLEEYNKRVQDIEQRIHNAGMVGNYSEVGLLNAEYKKVHAIITLYKDIIKFKSQINEVRALIDDPELGVMAEDDEKRLKAEIEEAQKKLMDLTLPALDNDDKNAILEIRAGTGGAEAAIFSEELMRMYMRYCNKIGLQVETLDINYQEEGGIKQAILLAKGNNAFGTLRFESGVHRVQRVPVTETSGRIHTSAASVVVLPEVSESDIEINPQDIKIDVYRAGGPGGQSVNTTDSAVRITHLPTGIVVTCQDGKSQHKNKEKALSVLYSRLYSIQQEQRQQHDMSIRQQAIQGGDRSAKIRTYNFPQNRITDHRINLTLHNLSEAIEGELDELVPVVNTTIRRELAST